MVSMRPPRGRSGYQLVVAQGKQPTDRWTLPIDRALSIGRAGGEAAQPPDVDLWPDRRVSREHAQLWQDHDVWRIKDIGSKHGIVVDGQILEPGHSMVVRPWSEIVLGDTTLFLAPPNWHRLTSRALVIDLAVVGAVNSSLAHAGLPIVDRLVARSRSDTSLPPTRLRITLDACIEPVTIKLPAIQPGASVTVSLPQVAVRYDVLEGQTEQARRRLTVTLDGEPLRGEPIHCWSLPYNEWSTLPEHRRALATFILPNHPAVTSLCTEVVAALDQDASARDALAVLFEIVANQWQVIYGDEPLHWAPNGQKIRLPHQVLVDGAARRGEGTCIDLALLVAACLENLGHQPLIAIVDLGEWWHALVGCWDPPRAGLEILTTDAKRLLDGAIWLDPTGLARGAPVGHTLAEACAEAERCLREPGLLYGLDVAAARLAGIMPLPFSGTPSWSPAADEAIRSARAQATAVNGQLCSAALLAGLLASGDPLTRNVVADCTGDADRALQTIVASLPPARPDLDATLGYRRVLSLARSEAAYARSPVTLTSHLLATLVAVKSASLAVALAKLGTNQDCLAEKWRLYGGPGPDSSGQSSTSWI